MSARRIAACAAALHLLGIGGASAAESDHHTLPADASADTTSMVAEATPQDPEPTAEPTPQPTLTAQTPTHFKTGVYLHVGGGAGFAFMSSDAITKLFNDQFTIGVGLHFSWSVTLGYRSLAQLEFRRGDSSHTLRNNDIVNQTTTEIPMDYDFTEYVAKANLFGLTGATSMRSRTVLFVVAGTMTVEYLDEAKDGFKGSGTVFGFEIMRLSPNGRVSASAGLRRYGIEFDEITLLGQTVEVAADASNWVFHMAMTIGLGF